MQIKIIFFFLVIMLLLACNRGSTTENESAAQDQDSLSLEDQRVIRNIGETLSPVAKKEVENWPEYEQLDQILTNYYSITPTEALTLAKELATTTQQLKDSLKIERFKEPDVAIRINVLHNYALRLSDMATIQNIGKEEIITETQNILDAFSALNSKLNNVFDQEKLEAELKEFKNP